MAPRRANTDSNGDSRRQGGKVGLGGADFSGADLWRTDFSQATGLSAEKFARSSWKGAIFDPHFLKSLEQRYPNEGTANERKKGREECQTIGKK